MSLPESGASSAEVERFQQAVYQQSLKIEPRAITDRNDLPNFPRIFADVRVAKARRDVIGTLHKTPRIRSQNSFMGAASMTPTVRS